MKTLEKAYKMAKENNGAPGVDGVTFADIETRGRQQFLQEIQQEIKARLNLGYPLASRYTHKCLFNPNGSSK